jgi:hypothetical protein
MNTIRGTEPQRLIVREGQMVFDIPSREDGVEQIVYVADYGTDDPAAPINLGGAWACLIDGDAMLEALDRIESTSRRYPA